MEGLGDDGELGRPPVVHDDGEEALQRLPGGFPRELQELAVSASRNTLAIADELRSLAEKSTGMHPIPVS